MPAPDDRAAPRLRGLVAVCAATVALAVAPQSAMAVPTYDDYSSDGAVGSCDYSASQLQNDINNAPSDIRQYDPGYLEALRRALNDQATGACDPSAGPNPEPVADSTSERESAAGPTGPLSPPGASGRVSSIDLSDIEPGGLPAWATTLGVFGGLLAVAAALLTLLFARQGLRTVVPGAESGSALSDYWWALRERLGR